MIQDIYPSKLNNNYMDYKMTAEDYVLWFNAEGKAYVRIKEGQIGFATGSDMKESPAVYLFSVDEKKFFLLIICGNGIQIIASVENAPTDWNREKKSVRLYAHRVKMWSIRELILRSLSEL